MCHVIELLSQLGMGRRDRRSSRAAGTNSNSNNSDANNNLNYAMKRNNQKKRVNVSVSDDNSKSASYRRARDEKNRNICAMCRRKSNSNSLLKRALYLSFGLLCVLQVSRVPVTCAYEVSMHNYETSATVVGRSAHAPRFGERLLPLRKQIVATGNSNYNNNVNSATKTGNAHSERSVNSQLHNSNYVVSERSEITAHAPEMYRVAVRSLDDVLHVGAAAAASRQAKQLLARREDTNVGEVRELLEPNSIASAAVAASASVSAAALAANVSKADRLVEMSTEFFIVPASTTAAPPVNNTSGGSVSKTRGFVSPAVVSPAGVPPRSVLIVAPKSNAGSTANVNNSGTPPTIVSTQHSGYSGLRKEPWVVPVLVLSSLTMLMMGAFEIFVLFKAWRTSPSRRHLFLGQMLLLGLFACAGLGAVITAQPSLLSCGTIRFGVGVAYALVFAALLVKCVFLISLNGGVYLPAPYQGLLLLFAVLIQVAIGAQWLLTQPPEIYTVNVPILGSGLLASTVASSTATGSVSSAATHFASTFFHPATHATVESAALTPDLYTRISAAGTVLIPLCKTQFSELLFSLIYIVFLIVFVAVLAIKSRGIRDNYREATYIGLAIGGAIPIWLGWMFVGLAVAERHKDACIAFGLVATSATVFLVMFMPKGRQLAAMGKEGLYVEDREEQFSSLSRAGSGYSPSFFHFKPIKYGVMGGGMQNSTSNTGNAANTKHCSNAMNGGDRVALVTAAPPSYTRMYHYFPAHLTTHPFCFYPQPPPPPPPPLTQLPSPPTLKQLGNSLTSMTQAHLAQTLRYPGLFIRPDETNLYTTLEPTLSSNPNVYFQRGGAVHPGMMY